MTRKAKAVRRSFALERHNMTRGIADLCELCVLCIENLKPTDPPFLMKLADDAFGAYAKAAKPVMRR